MMFPEVVIYHGGCWDGFAAAATADRAVTFGTAGSVVPVLVPGWYGMPVPAEVDSRRVMVVDFSFPPGRMDELAARAAEVVWIDHHKTAIDAMAGRNWSGHAILDKSRSGAVLTWSYFHPGEDPPWPVRYIEDRDLWRKALPDHDAVTFWLRGQPMTLESWDSILSTRIRTAVMDGKVMARFHAQMVENLCDRAFFADLVDNSKDDAGQVAAERVPMVTCSYDFGTDAADRLIRRHGVDMAGYVLLNANGHYQYGLRSRGEFDCSAVAQRFGGGGHRNAAGFTTESPAHVWVSPAEGL